MRRRTARSRALWSGTRCSGSCVRAPTRAADAPPAGGSRRLTRRRLRRPRAARPGGGGAITHLLLDPAVRHADAVPERRSRPPAKRVNPLVAEVPRLHANRPRHVADLDLLSAPGDDSLDELADADVLRAADVGRLREVASHQPRDAVDEVVDVGVRTHGRAVTPHFDEPAVL